jgi:UDP-2,3-diacylglucosamine pyrophosphatase LpxH
MLSGVRSVFVSDLHLGCKYARAEEFLDFLRCCEPDFLYLVGDVVDGWRLRRTWRWNATYNEVISRLVALSRDGTLVRYAPGNHDAFLRAFLTSIGRIELADEFLHATADGRRLLVTHGDRFDRFETGAAWLSVLATACYDLLLGANRALNAFTGRADYRRASAVKRRAKSIAKFVSDFERALARHARERRCDGIVCGHTHEPLKRFVGDTLYFNTGDWIEHCTALLEHRCGTLELISFEGGVRRTLALMRPDASPTASDLGEPETLPVAHAAG